MNSGQTHIQHDGAVVQANLRVLATSDLHMNLRGFDYVSGNTHPTAGLARLATLIAKTRAEAGISASVLLDNGDALQGAPMADTAAARPVSQNHPLAQAFEALAYDAIGVGNHDLDYGLNYLSDVAAQYSAPLISANLVSDALPDLRPWTIIERSALCSDGQTRPLRIGVLSVLPEQTMLWNSQHLVGRAQISEMRAALAGLLPQIKQAGADVVVLLAHSGIGTADSPAGAENIALQLAQHPDVDVVIAGHTHELFPNEGGPVIAGSDPVFGTLFGTPAAMPGFGGSHLAVVDLNLGFVDGVWQVLSHTSTVRSASPEMCADPAILHATDADHDRTKSRLNEGVGHIEAPINSYFSFLQTCPSMVLSARAKRLVMAQQVAGSALAELPLLVGASAYASGGLSGSDNYVAIGAGSVSRRDMTRLIPYDDAVWGVVLSGREIRDWLDRSAVKFHRLCPDAPDQLLIDPTCPGFNFDVLHGLDFTINPTLPSRFSTNGDATGAQASRIENLRYNGLPVRDDQSFLVAATSYRLSGGGQFPGLHVDRVAVRCDASFSAAMGMLLNTPAVQKLPMPGNWQLTPNLGIEAVFHTNPAALTALDDIASYRPKDLGPAPNGFQALGLHL